MVEFSISARREQSNNDNSAMTTFFERPNLCVHPFISRSRHVLPHVFFVRLLRTMSEDSSYISLPASKYSALLEKCNKLEEENKKLKKELQKSKQANSNGAPAIVYELVRVTSPHDSDVGDPSREEDPEFVEEKELLGTFSTLAAALQKWEAIKEELMDADDDGWPNELSGLELAEYEVELEDGVVGDHLLATYEELYEFWAYYEQDTIEDSKKIEVLVKAKKVAGGGKKKRKIG